MPEAITLEQRAVLDELCDRFERCWRQNQAVSIEALLADVDAPLRAPLLRELLLLELELLAELHKRPRRSAYLERFPENRSIVLAAFRTSSDGELGSPAESPQRPWIPTVPSIPKVRCPSCHQPATVESVATAIIVCESCGNRYRWLADDDSARYPTLLETLGRFEIIERIGMGGYGCVWKAFDCELERIVAVKVPRSSTLDADELESFLREARAAAQLRHPNIVTVYESGRVREFAYIVSDYIEGMTLGDWTSCRQPTFDETAKMCTTIAKSLHSAHEQGVVHRDLKPANVLIDANDQPHLTDFGLARREFGEVTMTAEGVQLGTPAYMSPELAQGEAHFVDRRSDIYSLGVILYEMLTGERPFLGNVRLLIQQVIHDEPRSPRRLNDRIPRDLDTICMKCLQKSAAGRYATAAELAADLDRFLGGRPILARPVGRIGRSWRWCKRNAVLASLIASILLILVGVAVSATAGMIYANRLRLEAEASAAAARLSADEARRNAVARDQLAQKERVEREKAEEANRFLIGLFQSADPLGLWEWGYRQTMENASSLTAVEIVHRGVRQLSTRKNQPEVQAMMADTLGSVLCSLGDMAEGERLMTEALEYRRVHKQEQPLALATTLLNLGHLHLELGHYDMAEKMCREALQIRELELGSDNLLTADAKFAVAWTVGDMRWAGYSKDEDVEQMMRDVLAIRKTHLPPDDRKIAMALSALGAVLIGKGRNIEGLTALTEAAAIIEKREGTNSASMAIVAYFKAELARRNNDRAEAVRLSREVVARLEPALGPEHPVYGMALANLAGRLREADQADEGVTLMRRALSISRRSPMRSHPKVLGAMVQFADFLSQRGITASEPKKWQEDLREAASLYDEVLQSLSRQSRPNVERDISAVSDKLAKVRKAQNQQLYKATP